MTPPPLPEWLAKLRDALLSGMPAEDAAEWPIEFAQAIREETTEQEFNIIKWKFLLYIQKENRDRVSVIRTPDRYKALTLKALDLAIDLLSNSIKSGSWDRTAARAVRYIAHHATKSANSSASRSGWAAKSASIAIETAAKSTARSAARGGRSARAARAATFAAEEARLDTIKSTAWHNARLASSAAWAARSASASAEFHTNSAAWAVEFVADSAAKYSAFTNHSAGRLAYFRYSRYLLELLRGEH